MQACLQTQDLLYYKQSANRCLKTA